MSADGDLRPEISVVIPCYNEQENARAISRAIISQLETITNSFDLIFIDNSSTDRTVDIIRDCCAEDKRIRLIVNTRNFGQMRSPTHAIFAARGRAVIGICADFQDPPELLPQFVERWRAGSDIVLGVRNSEKSSMLLTWARNWSYAIAKRVGDYPIIRNATGFGLYDQRAVRAIANMAEPEPFFRGMLVETGFTLDTIPYDRPRRAGGRSNNNFYTLLDFALSSVASFSKRLIRAPFFIGVALGLIAILSLLTGGLAAIFGAPWSPWLIAAGIEFQFGLLFGFLGLMGDQIRLITERTRKTPLVFERERINFPEGY